MINIFSDYIMNYQFVKRQPIDNQFKLLDPIELYQIATFPVSNKTYREIRIVYIDEYNRITNAITKYLTKKQYKYILKNVPSSAYKLFPVYTLNDVKLPSINDIMTSRSINVN